MTSTRVSDGHRQRAGTNWLDLYLEEVTATVIRESRSRDNLVSNLSQDEEEAIQMLIRDDSIVIRPADKGSGIVILDTEDFMKNWNRKWVTMLPTSR